MFLAYWASPPILGNTEDSVDSPAAVFAVFGVDEAVHSGITKPGLTHPLSQDIFSFYDAIMDESVRVHNLRAVT